MNTSYTHYTLTKRGFNLNWSQGKENFRIFKRTFGSKADYAY